MREGEPSRTAFGAAAHRAVHQDLEGGRIFRDPLAWAILGADPVTVVAQAPQRSRLRLFIAARHRFAEDSLAAAVERGTRQVVVLGAGLDTLGYRNPFPETRVLEVDFPATGEWKRERLSSAGIEVPPNVSYVGIDFEREELMPVLAVGGLEVDAPTFFVWLGVVPYLTGAATTATLTTIAGVPGAEVVFDYAAPARGAGSPGRAALAARVAEVGEPLGETYDPSRLDRVVRDLGFSEVEDLGRPEIRSRYLGLPPGPAGGGAHVVRARVL